MYSTNVESSYNIIISAGAHNMSVVLIYAFHTLYINFFFY